MLLNRPEEGETGTRAYRSGQRLRFVTSRSRVRIGVAASFFVEAGGSSDSVDSEHDGLEWFGSGQWMLGMTIGLRVGSRLASVFTGPGQFD